MRNLIFILVFAASVTMMVAPAQEAKAAPAEKQARLEELFLWKISDELKLNQDQQKKLEDVVHDLASKKAALTAKLDEQLKIMKDEMTPKARKAALRKYRQILISFQQLPLEEMDKVKSALGEEKLVEYLSAKKELIEKVKSLIVDKVESSSAAETAASKPVVTPTTTAAPAPTSTIPTTK